MELHRVNSAGQKIWNWPVVVLLTTGEIKLGVLRGVPEAKSLLCHTRGYHLCRIQE